jgi:hypothetical protein
VNEGVNNTPREQSLHLGAEFIPGGQLMLLKTDLCLKPFLLITFIVEKVAQKLGYLLLSFFFKNQSSNGQKFAQSGHSGTEAGKHR